MYKHIFGPVPSRRLGVSLGIDLVPHKVCSLNCIYCECGATTNLTIERKEYVSYAEVIEELKLYLKNDPELDYITFSGSGEPTLNTRIGDIVNFLKTNYPNIPLAVLTNGSLFYMVEVRKELLKTDMVLPSLDAASDLTFRKINRPYHSLYIKRYINSLVNFRSEYSGEIRLEVFIIPGYNDNEDDLNFLKKAFEKIKPDLIQLNSLDRPGAVPGLKVASKEELQQIINFWGLNNVEIIAKASGRKAVKSYREDIESIILETITRRPCTVEDISNITGLHKNEVNKYLDVIESRKMTKTSFLGGKIFYNKY